MKISALVPPGVGAEFFTKSFKGQIMRKNFRTYDLAIEFYHRTTALKLPRHLKDQLDRAASSIVLNIAEGDGRGSKADRKRFFTIAFGSLRESQAILDLNNAKDNELALLADKLAAHLYRLNQNAS